MAKKKKKPKKKAVVLDLTKDDDWMKHGREQKKTRHHCQTCGNLSYFTQPDGTRKQHKVPMKSVLAICSTCLTGSAQRRPDKPLKREAVKLKKTAVKRRG
jgi:hypothetical protein